MNVIVEKTHLNKYETYSFLSIVANARNTKIFTLIHFATHREGFEVGILIY